MTKESAEEKARKRAARLRKRREALVREMRKDVLQLRQIIRGPGTRK
jgi:hypothetical protein